MARAVVNRLLHEPTLRLKGSVGEGASYRYVNALHELFGLEAALAPREEAPAEVTAARGRTPQPRPVIRLGTRRSALALAQARWVAERLDGEVELVPIKTAGDERRGPAPVTSDKARFVKEIEEALLAGRDRPGCSLREGRARRAALGLGIVAVPRAGRCPRDALCGAPARSPRSPRARSSGTASVRRRAELLALRPDLAVRDLRGNVDTRLRRLAEGHLDAIVLAQAGPRPPRTRRRGQPARPGWLRAGAGPGLPRCSRRATPTEAASAATRLTDHAPRSLLCPSRGRSSGASARPATRRSARMPSRAATRCRLTAFVGLPDGTHWIRDELERFDRRSGRARRCTSQSG